MSANIAIIEMNNMARIYSLVIIFKFLFVIFIF